MKPTLDNLNQEIYFRQLKPDKGGSITQLGVWNAVHDSAVQCSTVYSRVERESLLSSGRPQSAHLGSH